jgi:hypothetical protein
MAKEGVKAGLTATEVNALIAAYRPPAITRVVVNKSGGTLAEGDVVVWDGDYDNAVRLASYSFDERAAGVVYVGGANGAAITIITHGYAEKVLTTLLEGSGRGYFLITTVESKQATAGEGTSSGIFGIALTPADADGYVEAMICLAAEIY